MMLSMYTGMFVCISNGHSAFLFLSLYVRSTLKALAQAQAHNTELAPSLHFTP